MDSIGRGTPQSEIDLATLATNDDVSEMLWWMYQNPDHQFVAYIRKGDLVPSTLREYVESGYITTTYRDHYYRRTQRPHDWYRLPGEYWSREGDALDETWPAHLRKNLRNSERYWMV